MSKSDAFSPSIVKKTVDKSVDKVENPTIDLKDKLASLSIQDVRSASPSLGMLRIEGDEAPRGSAKETGAEPEDVLSAAPSAPQITLYDTQADQAEPQKRRSASYATSIGIALSLFWAVFCVTYFIAGGEIPTTPAALATIFGVVLSPVALLWLVIAAFKVSMQNGASHAQGTSPFLGAVDADQQQRALLLGGSVEDFSLKVNEMAALSDTALKSLAKARQGLRMEVRDFSGVSKKAEFHIDRLAQSLNERSSKLMELTDEVSNRVSAIDEKTKEGVESWDLATSKVLERSGEMEASLGKGADKIIAAADQAHEKTLQIEESLHGTYESLNGSIDQVSGRLDDLAAQLDTHVTNLGDAAHNVSGEAEKLGADVQMQVESLEDVTQRVAGAMAQSTQVIQEHRDELDQSTQTITVQSEKIEKALHAGIERFNSSIGDVVQNAEDLEDRIQEKTETLRTTIQGISKEADIIDGVGTQAANKLGEALSAALSGSESISHAVRRAVVAMDQSSKAAKEQADSLITQTKAHIDDVKSAGNDNAQGIKEIVSALGSAKELLDHSTKAAETTLQSMTQVIDENGNKAAQSVVSLSSHLKSLSGALSVPLEGINRTINDVDQRHKMIEEVLGRRVNELSTASDKAVQSAEIIRESLKGQAQEISSLSGEVSGHARTINAQMKQQKESLSKEVSQSLASIDEVSKRLSEESIRVNEAVNDATQSVGNLKGEIAQEYQEISDHSKRAQASMAELSEDVALKTEAIKGEAEQSVGAIAAVHEAIDATMKHVAPEMRGLLNKTEDLHGQFTNLKQSVEEVSESNLSRIKDVGIVFDERLADLQSGSKKAVETLEITSQTLQERTQDIREAAESADGKMKQVSHSLQDQSSDIHLLTDKALLKIENVQQTINEQFHEFSASVSQAVTLLAEAGSEFEGKASDTVMVAQRVQGTIEETGQSAINESEKLTVAAQMTADQTEKMMDRLQGVIRTMLENAKDDLAGLTKTSDALAIRSQEAEAYMKSALQTSEAYGEDLKAQAKDIARISSYSSETLVKASTELTQRMGDITHAANDASNSIEGYRKDLSAEAERLMQVSSATVDSTKTVIGTFADQAAALFKASQDAEKKVSDIRKTELRTQRQAFMTSAKFIVESLHSLSVDVTRLIDGDISEKTWKTYQKGDISAFTRRLAEDRETWPLEKAQAKFAKDSEFRNYAQRYLRQFEDMYEQAISSDHASILSTTIGSSEVAKLYEFLCEVSAQDSCLSENAKAA